MAPRHPIPGQFDQDPRVAFDKTAGKYQYEDEETGQEFEWNEHAKTWLPLLDESSWKAQQAAYSVAGVDETTPANAVLARQQRIEKQKKRKAGDAVDVTQTTVDSTPTGAANGNGNGNGNGALPVAEASSSSSATASASSKPAPPQAAPKKTAVWVSNLPPNANIDTIASVFSKAGVLMIGDDGGPRVKLYYDEEGNFKGEALVMYFKEGSVTLAVTLLDDTELEMGAGYGNMKVKEADYEARSTQKTNEDKAAKKQEGEKTEKKRLTAEEKQRMTKRIKRMQDKVTWHSDDEDDDPLAPIGGAPRPGQNRYNRVVVLKGMFTLSDLERDPALLLELKEDVREECETLGQVTSCTLFDKEEEGVMTIKFKEATAAQACVMKMNGRFFDGRKIYAGLFTGKERYKRTTKGIDLEDDERDERERLDNFAQWLVDEDGE